MNRGKITPYQRFYSSLQTSATRKNYVEWFKDFCEFSKIKTDDLLTLSISDVEDLIFNYIQHLKIRVEDGTLKANSVRPMIAPIEKFCKKNKILIDWDELKEYLPKRTKPTNQGAWTDEEIRKQLDATTSPMNRALIHVLASTGARIGALPELNVGDINQIEDGAWLVAYKDDLEEYPIFLNPEALQSLKDYFEFREHKGFPVTPSSPIFCKRDYHSRVTYDGLREVLTKVQKRAGLRGEHAEKKRSSKSPNHAFRKRFELCLKGANLHSKDIELFCGSVEFNRDRNYYQDTVGIQTLWKEYKKAIPLLTIDPTNRLKEERDKAVMINEEFDNILKQRVAEMEEKYQERFDKYEKTIEELAIMKWHEHMKNYFRDQLEGRGHPHTDKNYREWMRGFVNTKNVSEMLKFMRVTGEGGAELIKRFEETENHIEKREEFHKKRLEKEKESQNS